jgi:hypothetical protein
MSFAKASEFTQQHGNTREGREKKKKKKKKRRKRRA